MKKLLAAGIIVLFLVLYIIVGAGAVFAEEIIADPPVETIDRGNELSFY
ncbi:MAG: hypothetical protein ACOX8Q_02740 [Christensenellales bacterium]